MQHKKIPIRTCVVCRQRFPQKELLRHVAPGADADRPLVDCERILPGRGFYLCTKEVCGKKFQRYQGWRRKRKEEAPHDHT